jgi:hypothetical protein
VEDLTMYFDTKPCGVCGSDVRLQARDTPPVSEGADVVGQPDGVVGDADSTVDARVCTNPRCATNAADRDSGTPAP